MPKRRSPWIRRGLFIWLISAGYIIPSFRYRAQIPVFFLYKKDAPVMPPIFCPVAVIMSMSRSFTSILIFPKAATALDIINPKKIHYGRIDESVQLLFVRKYYLFQIDIFLCLPSYMEIVSNPFHLNTTRQLCSFDCLPVCGIIRSGRI